MSQRVSRLAWIVLAVSSLLPGPGMGAEPSPGVEAKVTLARLIIGNGRFAGGHAEHPNQAAGRREAMLDDPAPDAIVIACSDAQVPPEIIFDQGLGTLYVVRTAGGVLDFGGLASVENAIMRYEVPLVIVLGHQKCQAIRFALDNTPGAIQSENLSYLVRALHRGLAAFVDLKAYDPLLEEPVRASVDASLAALLERSAIVRERVRDGRLAVMPALYAIESGRVELWDPPAVTASAPAR